MEKTAAMLLTTMPRSYVSVSIYLRYSIYNLLQLLPL
jgi:hypothetical protein